MSRTGEGRPGGRLRRRTRGPQRFAAPDLVSAALADLTAAIGARRLLVDVSGPETPSGGALLIGAACASGMPTAAYACQTGFTHAVGREPNWRNLYQ